VGVKLYRVCCNLQGFIINLFMTVGLFPIIGIPMILFSYGGSSLICASFAFSIQALIISAFRDVNRLGV